MILSNAQVQRFWREWSAACKAMNWTRAAGMTAISIDAKRKELLKTCGFDSLTEVDRIDGFTKVLKELQVLQGTNLQAARESEDLTINRGRFILNHILTVLVPCLELYIVDVKSYIQQIMASKIRWGKTDRPNRQVEMTDLDPKQLKDLQMTLAARLNTYRNKAGDSIHDMKIRAALQCDCAHCVKTKVAGPCYEHGPAAKTPQEKDSYEETATSV